MLQFGVAAIGLAVSCLATWCLRVVRTTAWDEPGTRSLHRVSTRRSGGAAIAIAIAVATVVVIVVRPDGVRELWPVAVGAMCIVGIGLQEDRRGVAIRTRLAVQVAAAGVLVVGWGVPEALELPGLIWTWPSPVAAAFTVLLVVWMTNLYNFMDGIDGLAAGMAVVGFAIYALLALDAGAGALALVAAGIAGSAGGFLFHNFAPAKIFMGDTGATLLGYLAGALAVSAQRQGAFPLWIAVLVFSPFVADATATLLRRGIAGEKVWEPHRTHFYQRLAQAGWGHRATALLGYLVMLAVGASATTVRTLSQGGQWAVLAVWAIAYVLLARWILWLQARYVRKRA